MGQRSLLGFPPRLEWNRFDAAEKRWGWLSCHPSTLPSWLTQSSAPSCVPRLAAEFDGGTLRPRESDTNQALARASTARLRELPITALGKFGGAADRINRKLFSLRIRTLDDVLTMEAANRRIADFIAGDSPALVARVGSIEQAAFRKIVLGEKLPGLKCTRLIGPATVRKLEVNAGLQPADQTALLDFYQEYSEALEVADMLAIWHNRGDNIILSRAPTHVQVAPLAALCPVSDGNPWTKALAGRNVLVVHPFVDSFKSQADRLDQVWPVNTVPRANYSFLSPPQTSGTSAPSAPWKASLRKVQDQVSSHSADIALVAAGAYGLPIAASAKRSGKVAIVVGGGLQIFFGVKGARWDKREDFRELYNEFWVRPLENERPPGADQIEGACYW